MIRNKIFALLFVLFFIPQSLYATVHPVSHNEATIIELQDNDEIELVDFPVGWVYSRIVFGLNSVPSMDLSGYLVANDCYHKLHGSYEEFEVAYTGNVKIIYHGPEQRLPVQWWVDANPIVSTCKSYSEMQRKDSIFTALYNIADSVYSNWTKDYIDLGDLNSGTYFEGTSAKFKITRLPEWFFNRIYVQVEPIDGRELDGSVYSGGAKASVNGYSSQFVLEQKTMLGPTFELAFPEYRRVKLKWWAEVQTPSKQQIETKQKDVNSDSVEVEYSFGDEFYSKNSVKIVYDRHKFLDGKIPVIKRFSFNPHGNKKSQNFGMRGDVYEIEAKMKPGDSVLVAIPLGNDYQSGRDSAVAEYYDEDENDWVEYPIDSIVDGYAYVKQPQRLLGVVIGIVVVGFVAGVACLASDACSKVASTVGDGLVWVYEVIKDLACGNIEDLKKKFGSSSSKPDWNLDQGVIDKPSIMQKGLGYLALLDYKRKNEHFVKLSDPYPGCGTSEEDLEICMWNRTRDNLDILLADAVLSQFNPEYVNTSLGLGVSKYRFWFDRTNGKGTLWDDDNNIGYNYDDYFAVSSGLIEKAAWFVNHVESCVGTINLTGKLAGRLGNLLDVESALSWNKTCNSIFGLVETIPEWVGDAIDCTAFRITYKNVLESHQGKLIAISEAMVRISLLAWLKKANSFRDYTLLKYKAAYEGILSWLELASPLLDYNNIAIKAYGSLALYEFIHYGSDENLKMINFALSRHYGDNGGFSEGMGYSQYIWDDLTYILAALKDAYKQKNATFEINERFLKSPDYIFEFSRPVGAKDENGIYKHYGLIPVEVDDGVTYNPDYRVWAKLKDDPKYLAMSEKYPLKPSDGKINPLVAFGFPDMNIYLENKYINNEWKSLPYHGTLWGDFKDGIGMITAVNGDDTVALSMIAENSKMWTSGQAHDQQDNLSITLTSSKNGFLIQDPGYSGFGVRSSADKFHRYYDHNVLIPGSPGVFLWGQDDNRQIPFSELKRRVSDFTGEIAGLGLNAAMGGWELFSSIDYNYTVEGGETASVLERKINEPQSGVIGFTATTKLYVFSDMPKYDNNRTVMYFGGNFWVIDRPRTDMPMMWLANSPKNEWNNIGIDLYGSWDGKLTPSRTPEKDDDDRILQNGSRSDFIIGNDGKNYLKNYRYIATDLHAKSYVMTYSLGDESFSMDRTYCPITAYQCFVNTSKNMRVIAPPAGESFKLCDVLPKNECSGEARSTGITMLAKTPLGEWTTRWVLDGELWAGEIGLDFKIASATLSRTSYIYEKLDGTLVRTPYKGTYLPALPILLLR